MSSGWPIIIASLVGGALIAAQGPIYARMASGFESAITAALIAFWIATIAITVVAFVCRSPVPAIEQYQNMPAWVWLGALVGVYQVLVSISAVPQIGVGPFIVIVVFGQIRRSTLRSFRMVWARKTHSRLANGDRFSADVSGNCNAASPKRVSIFKKRA